MANQQLLDYIRQSLQRGVSREVIKGALTARGWQIQEVEEAFNLVLPPSAEPPSPVPATPSTTTFLTPTALLLDAWALYKKRYQTFVGILLIPLLGWLLATGILLVLTGFNPLSFLTRLEAEGPLLGKVGLLVLLLMVLLGIIGGIVQLWSQVALLYAIKDSTEGIGVRESYRRARAKVRSYLWVIFLIPCIVFGGYLLFFVPGVIFLIWFSFASYIVVAENLGGMNALLKSREYVRGRWWGVFWRTSVIGILTSSPIIVLAIIAEQIGNPLVTNLLTLIDSLLPLFVAYPLMMIAYFFMYQNLKALKGEFSFVPSRRSKTIFGLIGLAGPLFAFIGIGAVVVLMGGALGPNSRDFTRSFDRKNIRKALELYHAEKDFYPPSLDQLTPEYFTEIPTDPKTGNPYDYQIFQEGEDYELCIEFETKPLECVTASVFSDGGAQDQLALQAYVNNATGFKIHPPYGWVTDETSGLGFIHAQFFNPSLDETDGMTFSTNISVASETTSLGLEIYVGQSKFLMQKTLEDYELTEDREVIVGEKLGYLIGGTFTEQGISVRNKQLIIVSGGEAYIVTGTALEETWEEYNDLIEASLMTFELL